MKRMTHKDVLDIIDNAGKDRKPARQNLIRKMQTENVTICEYCGAKKEGLSFVIGASREPAWMMVEGTGKMCCPVCWERARMDGQAAVERHCKRLGLGRLF